MPIYLNNNQSINEFNYEQIESDQTLKDSSNAFISNHKDNYESIKCLYLGQREYATVKLNDPFIDVIGSDAATTCHLTLIVDSTNKNCSLCHFDGSDMENGLNSMINSLKLLNNNETNEFDLYLVGGFLDDKKYSINTTLTLFNYFIQSTDRFNLKLCLVTKLNNVVKNNRNFPIAYGLGYNVKTTQIFMCNKFLDKGPDLNVRGARHFSEPENLNIYDTLNNKLVIGPFNYESIDYADRCVRLPKTALLKYFSTSPEQEPDDFTENLKKSFQAMIDFPNPIETYFNNKPKVYKKHADGNWLIET